ncbi:hypothetical protein HPK20_15640 [Vibrio fluvialis]|uniref:hypothetical protein n=1 Tax=Vibrio fluvialis TaxID=676 RepID=UPI001599A014|nr:hypothetical protein [Vibrio fluvialis]QKE35933.1 hypothetical protein HPK20_15640 [Vibrio fluvialis]
MTLTLAGDSATAGTDFTNTSVTITYEDGTTATVAVNAMVPSTLRSQQTTRRSASRSRQQKMRSTKAMKLHAKRSDSDSGECGHRNSDITDDGSNGGTDDRPTV